MMTKTRQVLERELKTDWMGMDSMIKEDCRLYSYILITPVTHIESQKAGHNRRHSACAHTTPKMRVFGDGDFEM